MFGGFSSQLPLESWDLKTDGLENQKNPPIDSQNPLF